MAKSKKNIQISENEEIIQGIKGEEITSIDSSANFHPSLAIGLLLIAVFLAFSGGFRKWFSILGR